MANEVRITSSGSYVEREGDSILLSSYGVYVESVEQSNEVDVTSYGTYIEKEGESLELSSFGIYVESYIPDLNFAVILGGKKFLHLSQIKVNFDVRFVTANTLNAQYKIPIIPDFMITINGNWYKDIVTHLGDLSNQTEKSLLIIVTDKEKNQVILSNPLSFVQRFDTGINIDNVLTYMIEIVGSGILQTL